MSDEKRRPWLRFYPSDWLGDERLRLCSYGAKGLWADLIALMHKGEPYGYLVVNGLQPQAKHLARILGGSPSEIVKLLSELRKAGVFSQTEDGTIYSRRMVRDKAREEASREIGKAGGNPHLLAMNKGQVKPGPTGGLTPPDNAHGTTTSNSTSRTTSESPSGDSSVGAFAPKPKRAKPRTALPSDWQIPADLAEWTWRQHPELPLHPEANAFKNHHISRGNLMADWPAAWRTWCSNWEKFRHGKQRLSPNRNGFIDALGELAGGADRPGGAGHGGLDGTDDRDPGAA